ncbi:hypothetical protein MMC30_002930 [Trapelia coarctata]|nr:hypothetical protein [Trapelia coarctata]
MDVGNTLLTEASALFERLATDCGYGKPFGSFSVSIYDSAWASMVIKDVDGNRQWLFPESFQLLLDSQLKEGGWQEYGSGIDGILNTMASLLAIVKHRKEPSCKGCPPLPCHTNARISRGISWLEHKLQSWDVDASDHVGFEILIPSLLDLLRREEIPIDFPGSEKLASLNLKKLARFNPDILYGPVGTTLVHSLEAFVGKIDFDKVRHHLVDGSMMGSPASTAAYLIHASSWDTTAEKYLRSVLQHGQGNGSGGFPSAFPTTNFELTWVLSTLLEAGFSANSLGMENVEKVANYLESTILAEAGTIGFSYGLLADADDTAKAILSLSLLGKTSVSPDQLIAKFDNGVYFDTYVEESNPSFSANCNVLNALLHHPLPSQYTAQISRATEFLCNAWYHGVLKDKWNLSPLYPAMLLSQAFVQLLFRWDQEELADLPMHLVRHRVPIILLQILTRTIQSQSADGSWGETSCEVTAYGVLTLTALYSISWASSVRSEILCAIELGRSFLAENRQSWSKANYIWIEKVTYAHPVLSQTYCLAAMNAPVSTGQWTEAVRGLEIPTKKIEKLSAFFSRIPLFADRGNVMRMLKMALIESHLFLPQLKAIEHDIFPRNDKTAGTYLEYIPLTWTACNNLGTPTSTAILWDMMIISMLNYQADEYMEAVIGVHFEHNLGPVKLLIERLCQISPATPSSRKRARSNSEDELNIGLTTPSDSSSDKLNPSLADIEHVLSRFITYVTTHPKVLASPPATRTKLRHELAAFLLAHITQIEDNARFGKQSVADGIATSSPTLNSSPYFRSPKGTYYDWVHTTSANHTSCPYSFVFYSCLISKPGTSCFRTVKDKYLAEDLCRRLATLCRQYNDYGSIARDRAERNLNSLDFPEFNQGLGDGKTMMGFNIDGEREREARKKEDLFWLAEYEREGLERAVERLGDVVEGGTMERMRLFVDVTDLYGQIYVARDIGTRTR